MKIRYFEKRGEVWLDFKDATGIRRRVPSGKATEAEAVKVAPAILARVLSTAPTSALVPAQAATSGPTLKDAYKRTMKERGGWIKSKDKRTIETTFEQVAAYWGEDKPLAGCTRGAVMKWRTAMLAQDGKRKGTKLSASTINHRLSHLSVLLDVCELPPHGVKHLPTIGNSRTRRVTDEEIRKGQAWLLSSGMKQAVDMVDLITVALELGARQGELLGLEWRNVTLQAQQDAPYGTVRFENTKNHTDRTLSLTAVAQKVLQQRDRVRGGPFANLDQDRATCLWDAMRTGIGLAGDDEFVFHSLRHENLSRLGDRNVNTLVIKAMAGHASVTTTERYVHASVGAMSSAQQAVRQAPAPSTIQ
jgi:integrase